MSSQTQTLFTEKTDKGTFANVTNVTSRRTLNLTEYKMYFQFLINPSYFCPSQECFLFLGRKNFRYYVDSKDFARSLIRACKELVKNLIKACKELFKSLPRACPELTKIFEGLAKSLHAVFAISAVLTAFL